MSIFAGIENARSTEGGNYLDVGVHEVEIMRLTTGKTRKGVPFFAADMKILGTNSTKHRIGEVANFFVGFDKDAALGNVKAFAVACLSIEGPIDPSTITQPVMDGLVEKGGEAVVGTRLKVQVTQVPTKSGGTYSKHLWFPLATQVEADN